MDDHGRYLEFRDRLRKERRYQTSPGRARWRLGGWDRLRAACFHFRLVWIYVVAQRMIRRGVFDLDAYAERSFKSVRVTEETGGQIEVTGLEHLAELDGPAVIIGNHMSSLETIMMSSMILPFREVSFVIKQALIEHPIFGPIMRAVPVIPVGRTNPREDLKAVLTQGEALLRKGVSVVIFPQATRSVEFDVDAFNTLGAKLAARAGVPVIPLALKTDFMGNGKWFKDLGPVDPGKTIHFAFGPPIQVQDNGKQAHETVVEFIRSHIQPWGGTVKGVNQP
ncbi:MAG: lysophospholipid acyltransferase family protein [bacterium]